MKKLYIAALILATVNSFSQEVKLKLASDIWPPFTNVEEKKSFSIDIVK